MFTIMQPCKDLENDLGIAFESLISSELIVSEDHSLEDTYNEEAQQWTSRIAHRAGYGFGEDDLDDGYLPEKEFKVVANPNGPFIAFVCLG